MNDRRWKPGDLHARIPSPLGEFVLVWNETRFPKVQAILLPGKSAREAVRQTRAGAPEPPLAGQLRDYLAGKPVRFSLADLDMADFSPFRREVSAACARIPRGQVRSYGELATMAGKPAAARAAGGVMAHNRFPIVVPCHRVVASDGHLHEFGGGLPLKRALLELEACHVDDHDRVRR